MTETKKAPARSGNYEASTNPKDQLHNITSEDGKQACMSEISNRLTDAEMLLEQARVVLGDQYNAYFLNSLQTVEKETWRLVNGYNAAECREGLIDNLVYSALESVKSILEQLEGRESA
ncbi:hypothetical protein [Anaerotruncus rubiinfantis]|uniref:hypothetical protein n=1 Tax=Anaerotruncus rubiinfantis TaxID=1720200 RepID=UPI0034A1D7A1